MSWLTRVLANFGLTRQLPTQRDPDLVRTRPKHQRAISKADKVLQDYKRQDAAIELRVVRRPR